MNLFQTNRDYSFNPNEKKIVFVSYKRDPDRYAARKCAKIFQETPGLVKCHRLFRPKISKVKTSFVAEIR